MATFTKELVLDRIKNGNTNELKYFLRELLEENPDFIVSKYEVFLRERPRYEHSFSVNGVPCRLKDAAWIHHNITKEEYVKFAEGISINKMYDAGELQHLVIKSFENVSNLQSFGRLVSITSILYKAIGGKRAYKKIYKERQRYVSFKDDVKYEGLLRALRDCKKAAELYESRSKNIEVLRSGKDETSGALADLI